MFTSVTKLVAGILRWLSTSSQNVTEIHVIDLQQTVKMADTAYEFVREAAANDAVILFVGTKKQAAEAVAEEATRAGQYYINHRWLGGTLTNWDTIQKRIARLKEIKQMEADGTFEVLPKKEVALLNKQRVTS